MLAPNFVRIIHAEKERELLAAIELEQRIAEMHACPKLLRPWYVRLGKKLSRLLNEESATEQLVLCLDPCTCRALSC